MSNAKLTLYQTELKIDLTAAVLAVALTNRAPDIARDRSLADIGEISPGGGYRAGGYYLKDVVFGGSVSHSGSSTDISAANLEFGPSRWGDQIGPFRYLVLYGVKGVDPELIGFWDIGHEMTLERPSMPDHFVLEFKGKPFLTIEDKRKMAA